MTLYSIRFIFFLLIVFVVYYCIPQKYRYIWLTAASLFFYATYGKIYLFVLLGITLVSYTSAILVNRVDKSKTVLFISFFILMGLLCAIRILNRFPEGKSTFAGMAVGVSFYTLAAAGYVIDVYNNKTECEKNFLKYLLFISFFPIVLSGPIERSDNLLSQIRQGVAFSYEKTKKGILLIMYGFFLKCLIADRMAIMVDALFDTYTEQTGAALLFGVILYAFQLYADFSGYCCIAIGASLMLGFKVMDNFKRPYFSTSIKEFWGRWHISLSTWLREYIYIPLGGNRKGKFRQSVNLLITFIVSGFWHGSGLQFIAWGLIHGLYQILSNILRPVKNRFREKLHVKWDCFSFRLFQSVITFVLVDFAWLFFRAPSLGDAVNILKLITGSFELGNTLENRLWLAGSDYERFTIMIAEVAVWLGIELIHERGESISEWLYGQNKLFRWIVYMASGIVIIMGMLYNFGVDAGTFIYTRF